MKKIIPLLFVFLFFAINVIANDNDSEVDDPGATSQPAAKNISSTADTDGEAEDVFVMDIWDYGTSDGLDTKITNIRVKPYTTNTADWTETIQSVFVDDGTNFIYPTVTIEDSYIDLTFNVGDLTVPDGDAITVTLWIYLNSSNISDGKILSFMVDADDHGFVADPSGSTFAATFTGDFNSNDMTIAVEGTQLSYLKQPTNVIINKTMNPPVKVAATDENGNIDIDFEGSGFDISITTSGTFGAGVTTTKEAVSGVSTFDDITYSATGTGITITADDVNDIITTSTYTSNTFNVISTPPALIISEVSDPSDNTNARFVEIYNASSSDVDLDAGNWYLYRQVNGGSYGSNKLNGIIYAGMTYVTATDNSDFISAYSFYADEQDGDIAGDGNDAYLLYYDGNNTSGTLVDIYGEFDTDGTGTSWEYKDKHAVRNSSISTPNTVWTSSEWTITSANVADMTPGTHGDCITWDGTTDATWSTTGNWVGNTAPGSSDNVKIPQGAGNFPSVDGTPASPAQCNNLTIGEDASIEIPAGKALTVSGDLTNNNTGLSGFGVAIKSDNTGNGSLIVEGSFSGNGIQVERYFDAYTSDNDGWHEIACPLTSFTVNGTSWDPTGTNSDLYYWDESQELWINYQTTSFDFEPGKGYLTADEYSESRTMEGTLNNSAISFNNLSYTTTNTNYTGFHLLGNPFPCAITYNSPSADWSLNNVSGTAKVWDESAGNYKTINSGDVIPSTNGFFVEVSNATNSITIPLSARTHDNTNNYKNQTAIKERLTVKVSNDINGYYDITVVGFKAGASRGYDIAFDSHKMFGVAEAPQLWENEDAEMFSDNYIPYSTENIEVPLSFKAGVNGTYHLAFNGVNSFYNTSDLFLEDKLTNKTINLKQQQVYDFEAKTDDNTNRFVLHFYNVTGVPAMNEQKEALIYAYGNRVIVKSNGEKLSGTIDIVNLLGQKIYSHTVNGSFHSVAISGEKGVYIVRYRKDDGSLQTGKVVIN